ncbi:MAG: hypothetical protein R3Y33_05130 [Clostridia bacterium]
MRILISGEISKYYKALSQYNYEIILTQKNTNLDCRTSYHSDLQVLRLKNNIIFVLNNNNYEFDDLKTVYTEKTPTNLYPNDCLLNCLILGCKVFCLIKGIDIKLKKYLIENDYELINVKQGYSKCSVLKLNENAIITADINIAEKAKENGIDVLLISQGDIELADYDYGFIGGASAVIENKVFFFGNINLHSDANIIFDFINKYNMEIVCLSDDKLNDIGGFVEL